MKKMTALALGVSTLALSAGALLGGPLAGPAYAQRPAMMNFDLMDADGDGRITAEEQAQFHSQQFSAADQNGDGTLSFEEFQDHVQARRAQMRQWRMQQRFQRMDQDGDGKLSSEEMPGARFGGILRLDANGDGVVTKDEASAGGYGRGAGYGPGSGYGRGQGPGGGPMSGGRMGDCPRMGGGGRW